MARATGLMPATIRAGIAELTTPVAASNSSSWCRQRNPGGGRKSPEDKDPQLAIALEKLMEPHTREDPMRSLRWSCKSTASWPTSSLAKITLFPPIPSADSSRSATIAFKATENILRTSSIPTGLGSLNTSPPPSKHTKQEAARSFPSIPKRKNWYATKRTAAENGPHVERRPKLRLMTLSMKI